MTNHGNRAAHAADSYAAALARADSAALWAELAAADVKSVAVVLADGQTARHKRESAAWATYSAATAAQYAHAMADDVAALGADYVIVAAALDAAEASST